jgi:1-deoxy-D-xylulose-5-phosphate synthase
VIGDGSLTGGMAYEGLNNLGHSQSNVIVILNDNGRSYAPTVSRLGESLSRLRSNPTYRRQQARLERMLGEMPMVGGYLERGVEGAKAAIREILEAPAFFENLGVRYIGPFDGHDLPSLERALSNAAATEGPVVVHVMTQKGRGYGPAENDPIKNLHDLSELKDGSFTAAFSDALLVEGARRPELVALTAAMPDSTGLLPFGQRFPGRLIDVGIAEQHAVTSAAGMAMGGLRPVFAVYSTFLTRAFDQVNLDVGLHRQPVVFVLDRAGITGDDGASHHGVLDMVLLTKVPDMTVFAPSSYGEVGQMLHDALDLCTGPAAIRFPKTMPPASTDGDVGSGLSARRVREGDGGVCIIGVGKMLTAARAAADLLGASSVDVTVWDPAGREAPRRGDARGCSPPPARGHDRGRPARRRGRLCDRRRAPRSGADRRTLGARPRRSVRVLPPREARRVALAAGPRRRRRGRRGVRVASFGRRGLTAA